MQRFILMAVLAATTVSPAALPAQRADRPGPPANRQEMERRFRQRLASVVKDRLALTDEQMRRVAEVNQKFDGMRRDLLRREFAIRYELRQELGKPEPSEDRVAQLITDQLRVERERQQTVEEEQADLARFLTAVQRAKYLGIQEQMRRQVEQLRGRPPLLGDSTPPGTPMGPGRRRPPPNR